MTQSEKFIDVLSPGIVRLIAKEADAKNRQDGGQRGGTYYITCLEDARTRAFLTGSEFDEAEEKAAGKDVKRLKAILKVAQQMFIDDSEETKKKNDGKSVSESVPLTHLMTFDKSKDEDAAMLNLIAISGVVAKDKKSFNGSEHFYHIEDAEKDAQELVQSLDDKTEVFAMIKKIDEGDYTAYIRYLLGTTPQGFSPAMKKKALLQEADKNPASVMKKLKVPDLAVRLLIHKMVESKVIVHDTYNGNFKKGATVFAHSFDDVLRFLLDEKNSQLLESWSKELAETK